MTELPGLAECLAQRATRSLQRVCLQANKLDVAARFDLSRPPTISETSRRRLEARRQAAAVAAAAAAGGQASARSNLASHPLAAAPHFCVLFHSAAGGAH